MVYVLYIIDVMCQKITFCMLCYNTCSWITSWDIQCSQHMCCIRFNASIKTYMIFPLEIGWTWSNEREPDFICYSGRTEKPGPICRSHCLVQIFITEGLWKACTTHPNARKSHNWFKLNEMNNPNYCMHNWQTFVSLIYYCRLIWVKEFKRLQQN